MTDPQTGGRPYGAGSPASRQVAWFETYRYAERLAAHHGLSLDGLPIPGTVRWCGMADDDARKMLALVLGGVRDALNTDARQTAMADASREIAAAAPWSQLAQRVQAGRGGAYVPRRKDVA